LLRRVVAPNNSVKLDALQSGSGRKFLSEKFDLLRVRTTSNIGDNPIIYIEALQGAINQGKNAKKEISNGDF